MSLHLDQPALVEALEHILDMTDGAEEGLKTPYYWVGDTAGKRRVDDDLFAGRLAFRSARRAAWQGLQAVMRNDLEKAAFQLHVARAHLLLAYEKVITPKQIKSLGTSAQRREGKVRNSDRDRRLAEAIDAAPDMEPGEAIRAAKRADPWLKAECGGLSTKTLLKAVSRFRDKESGDIG